MSIDAPLEVTKTVYTALDFLEWQRSGALDLRPYFQRGSVWTPKAKSYFIDTLLRGYPVPVMFLQNKPNPKTLRNVRQVVDGQQRLRTMLAYIDIECLPDATDDDIVRIMRAHNRELAGVQFKQLPEVFQQRLLNTEFSVHNLPSKLEDSELLQLFARLNSTGERLNDQELRNARYHGAFKTLAYELAYSQLDRWKTWGLFTPRSLAQMKEVELTSELMMVVIHGMASKSKINIDNFYRRFDDDIPHSDVIRQRFTETFDLMDQIFRPNSRDGDLKVLQTQSWVYALFSSIVLTAHGTIEDAAMDYPHLPAGLTQWTRAAYHARDRLDRGEIPDELARALRGASSDRRARDERYWFLIEAL